MIPTEVIHPLVFFSLLTLPSTVLSSTNLYVLNLVRHVEKEKKTFMSTNITTAYHILVEENSNLNDTSVFSATFVVFFSMLSLPSLVSSATNSHVLNVVRHVESIKKTCMSTTIAAACHIKLKKFQPKYYILFVIDLPGFLLHVVLAAHGVVDHQLTCT